MTLGTLIRKWPVTTTWVFLGVYFALVLQTQTW